MAATAFYAGSWFLPDIIGRSSYEQKQDRIRRWRIDKAYQKMQQQKWNEHLQYTYFWKYAKHGYNYFRNKFLPYLHKNPKYLKPYHGAKIKVKKIKTFKPEYAY